MNISQTETLLLAELGRREIDGLPLAVTDIAEALGIGQPSASKFIKRMAGKDGWITRDPLALTPAGKAVLATAPAVLIPHDRIAPGNNPRHMDLREGSAQFEELRGLAESIAEKGQLQPILVRPVTNGGYDIVGGERRWRATALLIMDGRLPEDHPVAATVRPLSDEDAMVLALAENMARRDMNPMDEAEGLFSVYGPRVTAAPEGERRKAQAETVERLAKATGQSARYIQARIRLARDLTEAVRTLVRNGELSLTFANEVATFDPADQWAIADMIRTGAEGWRTVEEIRAHRKGEDSVALDSPDTDTPDTVTPVALPPEAIRAAEAVALAEASGKAASGVPAMASHVPASEPNESGTYPATVGYTLIDQRSPRVEAVIELARCEDGLIRFAIDYMTATGGSGGPISKKFCAGVVTERQAHHAALAFLRDKVATHLATEPDNKGAAAAMAAIQRFAAAWQIDLDDTEEPDEADFNARPALNAEPEPGPVVSSPASGGGGGEAAGGGHSPATWPRDPEAATVTDRQALHALGRAISMGAIRIVIEADPLARSTAAELMARIAATQDDGAVQIKTGGQRAILSGGR